MALHERFSAGSVSRVRSSTPADVGLCVLPVVRLGSVRVSAGRDQLPLFPGGSADRWREIKRARRGVRFTQLPTRNVLNSPQQTKMGFWSVNPYVGCEFGCSYCYARPAHRYLTERAAECGSLTARDLQPVAEDPGVRFEREIFVKEDAGRVLLRTLRPERIGDRQIVIGTATDPYQPAEKEFGITRSLLERLAAFRRLDVSLITKSPLVTRDIDVLRKLQARSTLTVYVSLISTDTKIVRAFEARSPAPTARLRALTRLTAAGIRAGLIVAPVLPGITDAEHAIEAVLRAARQAGAHFAQFIPLRMYDECRARYLDIVRREHPSLLPHYERAFAGRRTVQPRYRRALSERVRRIRERYGVPSNAAKESRDGSAERSMERQPWLREEEAQPQFFVAGGV